MIFDFKRISQCLVTLLAGAATLVMATSIANATTLLGPSFPINTALGTETSPCVALNSNDGTFLVAWADGTLTANSIQGQIIDVNGNPVGGEIVLASVPPAPKGSPQLALSRPRVAFSPVENSFLVVWTDARNSTVNSCGGVGANCDIYGQIVGADGSLIGGNIAIATAPNTQERPDVAYDATDDMYQVVWSDHRNGAGQIWGQFLWGNGTFINSNFNLAAVRGATEDRPNVAWDSVNDDFLNVWSDARNNATTGFDIYGQLVAPGGPLIGSNTLISNAPADQFRPALAFDATMQVFLVAFADCRNNPTICNQGTRDNTDIYAQIVSSAGVPIGSSIAIGNTTADEYRPSVAFSPTNNVFQVIYSRFLSTGTTGSDIYGREVKPIGAVAGGAKPITATVAGNQLRGAIVYDPFNNEFLVPFSEQITSTNFNIWGQFAAP